MASVGWRSSPAIWRHKAGKRRRVAALIAVFVLASCDAAPPPSTSPVPVIAYGTPIDAGRKPDPAACQDRLRSAIGGAIRIRAGLVPYGVAATERAAVVAAADPAADTATFGIPLTSSELLAIQRGGVAVDPWSALSNWVDTGAPERFGGMWLEGANVVVTVVNGDPASLELARCVEPDAARYLWADISQADGRAIQDRLAKDMQHLAAAGVAINLTYYDVKTGLVMVGVTTPTPEIMSVLQETYGDRIRVIQEGPIQPA